LIGLAVQRARSSIPPATSASGRERQAQRSMSMGRSRPPISFCTDPNCISSGEIQDGTIQGLDIAGNTITSGNIQNDTVNTIDIADLAVTTAKLADNAVTTNKIVDGQVTSPKLSNTGVVPGLYVSPGGMSITVDAQGRVTSARIDSIIQSNCIIVPGCCGLTCGAGWWVTAVNFGDQCGGPCSFPGSITCCKVGP